MTQFDHESVKGTDLDSEELDDDALEDAEQDASTVTVGDTVEEATAPDAGAASPTDPTE